MYKLWRQNRFSQVKFPILKIYNFQKNITYSNGVWPNFGAIEDCIVSMVPGRHTVGFVGVGQSAIVNLNFIGF